MLKLSSTSKRYLIYVEKHVEKLFHISKDHVRTVTGFVIHESWILPAD